MQYKNQIEKLDCGIFVVQTLYKYFYDKWLTNTTIKKEAIYDSNGISLINLQYLLKKFNIDAKALKGDFNSLEKLKFKKPLISIIKNDNYLHYIIIEKITNKNNVIYYDPVYGKKKIPLSDFRKIFVNIIITCKPIKNPKILFDHNKLLLIDNQYKKEKILLILISLFSFVLSIIGSYYIKIIFEYFAIFNNFSLLFSITCNFLFLFIIKSLLTSFVSYITSNIEIKYRQFYIKKYLDKLEKVKYQNIFHYDESMHLKNMEIINKISYYQTGLIINIFINFISCFVFLIVLFLLNLYIFIISIFVAGIFTLITLIFKKKFKEIFLIGLKQNIAFKKIYLNIVNSIEQFKMKQTNILLKNKFDNSINEVIGTEKKILRINLYYSLCQSIIKNITNILIITFFVIQALNFNFSFGNVFIYISSFNFFITSYLSLIDFIFEYPNINQYIDNINGFLMMDEETNILSNSTQNVEKIRKIEIKNVLYKYGNFELKIHNVTINSNIKLTGKNGSGKSTFMKIVSLLIYQDEIYINNKHLLNLNIDKLRQQICYISSNEYLPNCTIYEYLTSLNNNNSDILIKNYELYNLRTLFEYMNLKLSSVIEDNGKNLSLGQKQFIYILKLFSVNSSLILLDEVFENIDIEFKNKLFPILKKYFNKRIVIETSQQNNNIFKGKEINCEYFI